MFLFDPPPQFPPRIILDGIFGRDNRLRKALSEFVNYYNRSRTHQSLNDNSPEPRAVEPPEKGSVRSVSVLGGLHHRYFRQAA